MTTMDAHPELSRLQACVAEAARLEQADAEACANLSRKLRDNVFHLVVAGQFKRGKSSLVNALLGAPLLPVGVVPLTSVITVLEWGETPHASVMFYSGETVEVAPEAIADYVTERGNPKNVKNVREVTVAYPSEWLRGGIRLVDTPGIGSVFEHNTDVTFRYLPQADAVLFVASVDQPVSRAEADFLSGVRQYADRIFCLLNKADYLSAEELAESVAFSTQAVREALGAAVPVFAVSARRALEGRTKNDAALVAASGFPAFDAALRRFLIEEKQQVWLRSVRRNLSRLLAQARLATDIEIKSLSEPLAQLEEALQRFAAKKQESLQARSDFEILLEGEARKLLKERIEPQLEAFKLELKEEMTRRVGGWFDELRELPSKQLAAEIERRSVAEVRGAYDRWRAATDAETAHAFDTLCARFAASLQATADELLRYSADLFSIPFTAVHAESLWKSDSHFYYKFWNEPGALYQFTAGLIAALPRFLAEHLLRERLTQQAVDLVETQAGRVRYDFDERLKKSVMAFRSEMLARMEATSAGIERAIEQGVMLRRGGEAEVSERRRVLEQTLTRIGELERRCALQGEAADTGA
ncbi:MAG: dynamin family protein [Rhodocyclaceae bacterium]|jgi:GTP-binding protein EngB required for normal cell division|nr:dynamin family protein [Rhodocyclaceae bacterium]